MSISLSSLAAVGLALLVASCGVSAKPRSAEAPPLNWNLHEGEVARLSFELSDTDIVGLSFRCRPGSGRVAMGYVGDENLAAGHGPGQRWRSDLTLASGRAVRTYKARSYFGEGGPEHTAETSSGDPVLQAFARSGSVSLNRVDQNAWSDAERSAIARFFDLCAA